MFRKVEVMKDALEALDVVVSSECDVIVAAGSFYLLNHVRPKLLN